MDAQEIINYIATAPKKTPVKVFVKEATGAQIDYGSAKVFGVGDKIVFGNWVWSTRCARCRRYDVSV